MRNRRKAKKKQNVNKYTEYAAQKQLLRSLDEAALDMYASNAFFCSIELQSALSLETNRIRRVNLVLLLCMSSG